MRPFALLVLLAATRVVDAAQSPQKAVNLDDFEGNTSSWKFVGGEEFPGAKGGMTLDDKRAHGGNHSRRIDADFRGGGAYVGGWRDLKAEALSDIREFRVWVRADGVKRLGVRLVDDTGQCHQRGVDLPIGAAEKWVELTLKVADFGGVEHWGGANDGNWHGPPRGLGLNIGRPDVADGHASLWIDDLIAVPITPGRPTLRAASIAPTACRPGYGTRVYYQWDAAPLGAACNVFVHLVNDRGEMVAQADHAPPASTVDWSGRVAYARSFAVPTDLPPGRYGVVVGLWDPRPAASGGGNRPFDAGPGLAILPGESCRVGSLEVAADAPLPVWPAPSMKLENYRATFVEDFDAPLSVSARGPGTRWIAHTPYAGDFGDALFGDPDKDSPFAVEGGILRIEARKIGGRWRSGLLCSVDPKGAGFSQKYGYFEMRARFPKGPGTWPAFWLMGVPQLVEPRDKKTIPQIEIDVVEQYGVGPNALHTTLHLWGPGDYHWAEGDTHIVPGMTEGFHDYGVLVEEDYTTFFYDGVALRRDRTPEGAKVPLYLMVDLALGGGWPIDRTPEPSTLWVDHIRVYAHK